MNDSLPIKTGDLHNGSAEVFEASCGGSIPSSPAKSLVELFDIFKFDTDKNTSHSYLSLYDNLFSKFANRKINLLEIGILSGGSLRLWAEYFHNKSNIIGIDNSLKALDLTNKMPNNVSILQKDVLSCNQFFLDPIQFDIVIDDGSHFLHHQLHSFYVFKDRIAFDGYFIIEDIQEQNIAAFKDLADSCDGCGIVLDRRSIKNREDDILFVYSKNLKKVLNSFSNHEN